MRTTWTRQSPARKVGHSGVTRAAVSIVGVAVAGGAAVPATAIAGSTSRVSLSSTGFEVHGGSFRPSFSADGRYVLFDSSAGDVVPGDGNGSLTPEGGFDVFVRDRNANKTVRVS